MLRRPKSFSCSPLMIDHSPLDGKRHSKYHTAGKMNILMRRIAIVPSNKGVVLTPRGAPEVLSTIVYFNGDSYVGEVDGNGLKSGRGIMKWENADVYDGEFKNDLPNGKGKYTWTSGNIYDGEFKDGLSHGKGKITWTNDSVFVGEFKDNLPNGKGKITLPNGSVYEGEFKDSSMHMGKFTYVDGSVFDGEFKDNKKHGKGKLTSADGSVVYEGEFKDDMMHGKGMYTCADGEVYEGEYKNNLRHGKGKVTYVDSSVYEGEFKDGKKHGKGKLTFADGDVYEGEFIDGLSHGKGKGKLTLTNGSLYEGEFKDGNRHGKGKLTLADGRVVYDGMWFKDKRDEFGLQARTANANGGGVDVVVTLDQDHIQCGICYNAFTADMASTDQTSRELLPVLGACGHYFCHGCIVLCRFMMGSNGAIGCPKCRKADQFMPGNPVHHILLIDFLRSARPIDKPPLWFEGKRDEFGLQTSIANANGGGVNVVFTLDQDHIQCGICYDAFTADMASKDQTSRDLLPVLGACGHYFCHGCIVRSGFMMGSNGAVGCPKCRKADQFMPGNPVPHIMLIDLLRSARPIDMPSSAED